MGSEKRFLEKLNKKKKKSKKKSDGSSNSVPSPGVPENRGGGKNILGGKVVSDPRFSSLHTDPRFREPPKRKTKVAIDSRFDRIFTDKSFLPSSAPVDKRGKVRQTNLRQGSLRHYYKMDEEGKREDEEDVEEGSDEDDKGDERGQRLVESDGGTPVEESLSEDEDNAYELASSTDTDGDESADEELYNGELSEMQEEVPEIDKETHRLAVVNMDWRYVKAVDLYVLLSSFVPPNGQIKSVAVYPSEFGLQRMKEEEVHGPIGLFEDEATQNDQDSSDSEIENEKLRAYEKSRMRYYYAVVECDSSTTADHIYKECDGLEFLQSSNALDLRFIPDSMEIKNPPRDVATEAPANYEGKDFYTRALQHSKVHLSWDEDEPLRAKTLRRKFNDDQLAELELTEFLASDVSESDDDDEETEDNNETENHSDKKTRKLEKYRALLESGDGSDGDGEEDGQDMEVTFNTGLEDLSKHILEKKDKKSESVWEAYLRKRREKKRARKSKSKHSSSDDDISDTDQDATEQPDDFFMGEPPIKKRKEEKGKKEQKHQVVDGADKATKEELELLLADDQGANNGLRGYNLKLKKAKGKRAKETVDEAKIPSSDLDDPRFAALLTSRDYALDPTDPQFKRSAAYARQRAHKLQKGDIDILAEEEQLKLCKGIEFSSNDAGVKKGEEEGSDVLEPKKEKHDLSSLVKSIKMKSKQVQLPSYDKTKRDGKLQSGGMKKRKH
ncbi:pre-rRNA-processing protein ESF1 [Neltuma alba]|uniref:pre-rRNA-processing protein ESF1 n=1 Tax=Neltuma alba TaxID=207710 RepID=UPI0010A2C2A0|nr:pre-rRNA-processing protein ESF1-like [Prosopis alba]